MSKKLLMATVASAIIFLMASPSYARTVYCTNCSDKFQQAIERVTGIDQLAKLSAQVHEAVVQTEQQITMVQQNIERYENMVRNTISLPMDIYSQLEDQYSRLSDLYRQIDTYRGDLNGIRQAYTTLYPKSADILGEFSGNFDRWSAQADKSTQALAELSGVQLEDLLGINAQTKADRVRSLLSTPEGRMQAMQAGNQLTAMQLQESQELRILMATALQQQASTTAKQEKMSQAEQEHMRQVFRPDDGEFDPRKAQNTPIH